MSNRHDSVPANFSGFAADPAGAAGQTTAWRILLMSWCLLDVTSGTWVVTVSQPNEIPSRSFSCRRPPGRTAPATSSATFTQDRLPRSATQGPSGLIGPVSVISDSSAGARLGLTRPARYLGVRCPNPSGLQFLPTTSQSNTTMFPGGSMALGLAGTATRTPVHCTR